MQRHDVQQLVARIKTGMPNHAKGVREQAAVVLQHALRLSAAPRGEEQEAVAFRSELAGPEGWSRRRIGPL
jgi:hypothetical protein